MTQWTTDIPTEPGWYWYRNSTTEPRVIAICEFAHLSEKHRLQPLINGIFHCLESIGGEWSERIPEPDGDRQ